MNKTYRSLWNAATNSWVAAAETAKSRSKGSARVARTAVAALVLGGASMSGAFATEVDAADEEETIKKTVSQVQNTGTTTGGFGTMSGGIGTMADSTQLANLIQFGSGSTAATASDQGSIAIGSSAKATAGRAVAIGVNTEASGAWSIAIGGSTAATSAAKATGEAAVALGVTAKATGDESVALGRNAQATATNAVALGRDSVADVADTVSVGNATTKRKIVNVAAGTQDTDAVNVSQLSPVVAALGGGATINSDGSVTGPTYTLANGGTQTTVDGALNALDGALTTANGNIARNTADITNIRNDMDSGSIGLVQQAAPGANLTVGANTDGAAVDFAGTAGARKLINVADGAVSTISKEAINGSQLRTVSDSVASIIGPGTTVNPDGSISTPGFTVGDGHGGTTTVGTVGGAVANLNDRVTGNETSITDIRNEMSSGTIGLVQQAGAGANLTVGKNTDGAAVDLTNNAGEQRKLIGVADGAVSTISKEAINGSQLRTVSDSVASVIGSGSTVNPDGSISAPSFTVGDGHGGTTTVGTVGGAVDNLNTRVTGNETSITDIRNEMSSGSIGLVQQAGAGAELTVGKNTDGTTVNFAGTGGARVLAGVANGTADSDGVNYGQLRSAVGTIDDRLLSAVMYDTGTPDLSSITLVGGTGGTYINNLAAGLIARDSMQAVNGGQLFDLKADFDQRLGNLSGRVDNIEAGGGSGGGGGGSGSDYIGTGKGENSLVVGEGSSATGSGSVAIGNGSVADRDDAVSVGSAGKERQITNVADGTEATDAVNKRQLDGAVSGLQNQIGNLQNQVESNRRDAAGGTATAVAIANLPQASLPGESVMALAAGSYDGESAMAIGVSTALKNGKWLLKASGSTNTRGTAAVGAGVGFRW
ncbi:YadA-like family protein [Ralstonia sp. ASV6]|uniref:YadA-like family protein n=1 Tax=Ralstonia sp. ASV6 TaxID=2795124 RepID=UPI0018EC8124|nr:YadA-like family protein [Ralstonia sp. ASV6]